MKLIEKAFYDWYAQVKHINGSYDAFEAGFRKAREMAAEAVEYIGCDRHTIEVLGESEGE